MKRLTGWPPAREDRHATALLHDEPGCRLVAFTLAAGQAVPIHTSASTVLVMVVQGAGEFSGAGESVALGAGDSAWYAPNEPHGMTAGETGLKFLAVITPSPSAAARTGNV